MRNQRVQAMPSSSYPSARPTMHSSAPVWETAIRWVIGLILVAAALYVAFVIGLVLLVIVAFLLVVVIGRRAVRSSRW